MDQPKTQPAPAVGSDITLPDDPRVLTILSTEHWSLLSARSLAYNEAFTRANMYLTFISLSFVGLALLAQAIGFSRDLLVIVALVLGFDLVVGAVTFLRVADANAEDTRAMHGMNRIRSGYVRIVPEVAPYFVSGIHDDVAGVMHSYYVRERSTRSDIIYGLSTSLGLVALVNILVLTAFVTVIGLAVGLPMVPSIVIAVAVSAVVFVLVVRWAMQSVADEQAQFESISPTPARSEGATESPPSASAETPSPG
jgi:hypothetical protein